MSSSAKTPTHSEAAQPTSLEDLVRAKKKSLEWIVADYYERAKATDRRDGAGKKRHRRLVDSAETYQQQVDVLDQVLRAYERAQTSPQSA